MDRAKFYNQLRTYTNLTQSVVQGTEYLLNEWDRYTEATDDPRHLAYILATAWHETNKTMQPVREAYYLGAKAESYRSTLRYYPYYGRGYVELTWKQNYERYGIADNPDQALDPVIAAHIAVDGMVRGIFTNKSLNDYFNDNVDDPVNARRIINGTDKADLISQYYTAFLNSVNNGNLT